jgi:hypothetical protein
MIATKCQTACSPSVGHPTLRARIVRMAAVWAVLGAVMGASVGMQGGGPVGAVAGMMAGMVELATLGVLFAVVGGTPQETVLGAVGGLLAGLGFGVMRFQAPVVLLANFGLIVGAIAGATLRAYLRLLTLPVVALGRLLLHRQPRPRVNGQGQDGRGEQQPYLPATPAPLASESPRGSVRGAPSRSRRTSAGGSDVLEPLARHQ